MKRIGNGNQLKSGVSMRNGGSMSSAYQPGVK
jgi:hypothetical protein